MSLRPRITERLSPLRRNPWHLGAGLSGESLSVIRGRKDILHKFFERSRRAVLRRTRLLRSEDSRIDGLEHLDVHLGFPRRKTRLRQRLLHLVLRKLLVAQIRLANTASNHRGTIRDR